MAFKILTQHVEDGSFEKLDSAPTEEKAQALVDEYKKNLGEEWDVWYEEGDDEDNDYWKDNAGQFDSKGNPIHESHEDPSFDRADAEDYQERVDTIELLAHDLPVLAKYAPSLEKALKKSGKPMEEIYKYYRTIKELLSIAKSSK